jgi:predicted DNA-binding transcriptional regulator AlpA
LRKQELYQFVGLRRTQIDELIKAGEFPKPVRLSDTGTAVAWLESEVVSWQLRRLAQRDNGGAVETSERRRA